jgi:sugar/nucleoside kinase (ribokinase family)
MKRNGIIAGGNWIVDHLKTVDCWPEQDTLANIRKESRGNGGSPYNILKDLRRLGAPFRLEGVGLVGHDELGRWIIADCRAHRIGTCQLHADCPLPTSYTDVMTVRATGRRTFFHQRGANAQLAPRHFDFKRTRAKFFHLGYLLLLDSLDAPGKDGRPRACTVLRAAAKAGLITSLDLVSEASDRFARLVPQVLPEVDHLFVNDYEAARSTGIELRPRGKISPPAVERAAEALLRFGVRRAVLIHSPEAVYARQRDGFGLWQASLDFPKKRIAGTAGAGDAFAAGVLYGLHEDWQLQRCLLLGVAAAAASLTAVDCSSGVRRASRCLALAREVGLRPLPR